MTVRINLCVCVWFGVCVCGLECVCVCVVWSVCVCVCGLECVFFFIIIACSITVSNTTRLRTGCCFFF